MKRVFKDGKYNHHLKKIKHKVSVAMKSQVAFAIMATTAFWLAFFLAVNQ